jgi:hypothetical protein
MQYLRRANGAERFVLSLPELRQHERLFLEGTAQFPICCRLSRNGSLVVLGIGRAHSDAGEAVEPELA